VTETEIGAGDANAAGFRSDAGLWVIFLAHPVGPSGG